MKTDEIRTKFLEFFKSKQHKVIPSDTLVPKDDPSLLFTGAGMNQFKEYFLGIKKDMKKAASCQKCFRTGDLDNVGKTPAHHTFFEMLGNFSFGDYFKKEAIEWAWEFMTEELKIKEKDLWVSVYKDDEESFKVWKDKIGISAKRIIKLGDKDNFWPSEAKQKGPNGPCGPCSEIFYDQGKGIGCGKANCTPACGCERFVEVWNLVFTQFNRKDKGTLEPLPNKNIDTGMGLERMAAVMQGVRSNFEIDTFVPIIEAIKNKIGQKKSKADRELKTITDHIRAVVFLIGDGVLPSNEGRGYVERMLLRRAMRFAMKLGCDEPFLYTVVPTVCNVMKEAYPELKNREQNISRIVRSEEERFKQTLIEGTEILEDIIAKSKTKQIPGEVVFKLYDTYGFPFDLTEAIAREKGFRLDKNGFKKAMQKQKELSRKGSSISGDIFASTATQTFSKIDGTTEFAGYKNLKIEAKVLGLFKKSQKSTEQLREGEEGSVVLDKTPSYGEAGGQAGDRGLIAGKNGTLEILNTCVVDKIIVHVCKVKKGNIKAGDKVEIKVDTTRRSNIARNHTATHILHNALRTVLGLHVHQSGSLVEDDRLRFDFTHFKALSLEELEKIEHLVNKKIKANDKVVDKVQPIEKARKEGAIALFGEKYEKEVRMISVGGYSKELCGGTHVASTGEIGSFKIISESSISAGVRRIEAVTGKLAEEREKEDKKIIKEICVLLNTKPNKILAEIENKSKKIKKLQRQLEDAKKKLSLSNVDNIVSGAKAINGIKVVTSLVEQADMQLLRSNIDIIKQKLKSCVVCLGSKASDNKRAILVLGVTKDLVEKGIDASKLINKIALLIEGSGGGRADFAQAGGKKPNKLQEALNKVGEYLK